MFVDASALVAIITREPEGPALTDRLQRASAAVTSPVAVFSIARKTKGGATAARADVEALLTLAGIGVVPITPQDADRALAAFGRYGEGTGHPARLDVGDGFVDAVAQGRGVGLLSKGADFALTDLGTP